MRVFAALVPSDDAIEHLQDFLAVRQDRVDRTLRWSRPYQWHLTLAFAPDVPDDLLDDLAERVASAVALRHLPAVSIAGGGAFPDPDRAKVVWAGLRVHDGSPALGEEAERVAAGCRTAFATAGVSVDGARFRPHVTVARLRRPGPVTRWVRLLDAYEGPWWTPREVRLIASHLGQGPGRAPRYEDLATCLLG
ncbi:MAG: RNA 2',3'-cyclic phosphodiesterase [Dermatophilaceae bacterium]